MYRYIENAPFYRCNARDAADPFLRCASVVRILRMGREPLHKEKYYYGF